ncbi:hypothetical protein GIB67_010888 [Kingdonia uniflora]|uniref:F-box domain-containing protein n=1 Tax=Kingdonia uniflora TaxID=39325 RepID=A0A7J7M4W9_9MAGN|nr:hypothetical protein GIB67_010888 [Kingdonia uniflora]
MDLDGEKKSKHSLETTRDQISNLPEELLLQIVSFLPTNDVISTSVLSTRWRSLWRSIKALDFNEYNFTNQDRFKNFVDKTLILFDTHINLQRYCILTNVVIPSEVIDRWVRCPLARNVQEFVLSYQKRDDLYCLPSSLFNSKSITTLQLSFCKIGDFNGDTTLLSLKAVLLTVVSVTKQTLQRVVTSFPVLEILSLRGCTKVSSLKGGNIRLRSLVIAWCICLGEFDMDVPNLKSFHCINNKPKFRIKEWGAKSLRFVENVLMERSEYNKCPTSSLIVENLVLKYCETQARLVVFSDRLQQLSLFLCNRFKEVQIKAPNLISFSFNGEIMDISFTNSIHRFNVELQRDDHLRIKINPKWLTMDEIHYDSI